MKKLSNIIALMIIFMSIYGCDTIGSNSGNKTGSVIIAPPIESAGIGESYILHDTAKKGEVNFLSKTIIDGAVYNWKVTDSTGAEVCAEATAGNSFKCNFQNAGEYTVTLNIAGAGQNLDYSGLINIPEELRYEVDLGNSHTIISLLDNKTSNGSLYVYGVNDKGQLCTDKELVRPSVLVSYTGTTSVAAGAEHTLFVNGNIVYGCGDNSEGQLGLGDNTNYDTPQVVSGVKSEGTRRVYVSAGGKMSVAGAEFLDGETASVTLYSWGHDETVAGNNQNLPKELTTSGSRDEPLVSTGNNFSIIRATSSYNMFSIGVNDKWQLGRIYGAGTGYANDNTWNDFNPYNVINDSKNTTDMATGFIFTPFTEKKLTGDFSPRNYLQNNYFARSAAGDDFAVVIKKETSEDSSWTQEDRYAVYVWGGNSEGQLGFANLDGADTVRRGTAIFSIAEVAQDTEDPNKVTPITDEMVEVAAGRATGFAISKTGKLYGWGADGKSQLTSNKVANAVNNKIYEISNPNGITEGYKKVWAGGDRVIALAGDNNLYTWGDNTNGILGTENTENIVSTPEKLMFNIRPLK